MNNIAAFKIDYIYKRGLQPRCSPLFVSLNPSALAKIADVSEGRSLAYGTELAARCSLVGRVDAML